MSAELKQLRLLADSVCDITLFIRPGGQILEANQTALDLGSSLRRTPPFLAKPFSPEALARQTREVLDAARSWPGRAPGRAR